MKFKKQPNTITGDELTDISKSRTLFIDQNSSSRRPLSGQDAMVNRDVTGLCDFLLAKGHTRRLYGIIGSTKINTGE
jgi:hypothetical protein